MTCSSFLNLSATCHREYALTWASEYPLLLYHLNGGGQDFLVKLSVDEVQTYFLHTA